MPKKPSFEIFFGHYSTMQITVMYWSSLVTLWTLAVVLLTVRLHWRPVEARAGYCRCSSMISTTQMLCQLSILAFLFVSNQNGSKRIKLDQIGVFTNQKMLIQNVVTFTMTKKKIIIFLIKLDQNCPK